MTSFPDLLAALRADGPLPGEPLGTAYLAGHDRGVDLTAHGYLEQEFLISGLADDWTWDEQLTARPAGALPFTTRILVRRPADPAAFSGAVYLEPNHADYDRSLTWSATAPWLVRSGHAHVGVTQEIAVLPDLARWDPDRYGALRIPATGQRWDIVGLVAAALKAGATGVLGGYQVRRVLLSGWSQTGTFCRTFLGEGFHDRSQADGRPVIDAYLICISSGGAGRPGYGVLRAGAQLPLDDPRRTISAHGVPVVELLSEGESETHREVLRPDADGPADLYRLYQVAGAGHVNGRRELTTNRLQMQERGWPVQLREINEQHSDGRMDLVARAVFHAVDRWVADGTPPPVVPARFGYADPAGDGPRGVMPESLPLARDADGNVLGGIRTPWVEVPAATYLPHSTPVPGRCEPAPHAPYSDPAMLADLVAHMKSFPAAELTRRYGGRDGYLRRLEAAAQAAAEAGWLLDADLPEFLGAAGKARDDW
jgi:hypothetical protein